MRKIFDFRCNNCGDFTEYTEYVKEIECPICKQMADKLISTPRVHLEGHSGSFPGAAMQWEKKHKINKKHSED